MLELNEEQRKALEGAVEAGLAGSIAEALDAAITQFCAAAPKPWKQVDQRFAELIEGEAPAVDSLEEMNAFLKQQIAERAQALASKLAALTE